jgi:hypothetical protein
MATITRLAHTDSVHSSNRGTMDVIESREQFTLIAAETVEEGASVYITSAGKVANADADGSGTKDCKGIAVRKALAGEAVTVLRDGLLGGFDLSALAFGDKIYTNATAGAIDHTAVDGSVLIGEVFPAHVGTASPSSAPAKVLRVDVRFPALEDVA